MKTPSEFATDQRWDFSVDGPAVRMLEARDAEWRRLVEEAQQRSATWQHNHEDALRSVNEARADAKRNALSNIELRIEVGRLKGESTARAVTIETLGADVKAAASEWDRLTLLLDGMYTERDRLRGELAEARRLVVERGDKLTLAIDFIQQVADGGVGPTEARAFLADFAAPPAEQATPEGALRNVMAGRLPWVPAEQAHSTYEDGEGRPAPLNAEWLISAKPIKAAKAQGEGAPYFRTEAKCGHSVTATSSVGLNGAIAAHEKECPNVQVAALAKRVDVIEEWARRQVAEPWFDPERRPAPPPPDAAGPGHVFECESGYAGRDCAIEHHKCKCGARHSDHAVPPIPGGK